MSLPEGFGFVAGRSRATARKLLASARAVGEEESVVRGVRDGYHVPDSVFDHYNEHRDDEDLENDAEDRVVKDNDPFTFNPPNTDGEPYVPSTTHADERTLDEGSTPITEAHANIAEPHAADQTGVGTDVDLADGEGEDSAQDEPKGNASHEAWLTYAKGKPGYDESDAELGRDELREKYGSGE